VYDDFNQQPADLSAYYENAERNMLGSMNDQLAARGMHGTTYGAGQIGDALTDLNAQRVRDEADFGLRHAGMAGSLAGAADQMDFQRLSGQMGAAGASDAVRMGRLNDLFRNSLATQEARRMRGRDYAGDIYGMTSTQSQMLADSQNAMFADDQAAMDAIIASMIGASGEAVNSDRFETQASNADFGALLALHDKTPKSWGGSGGLM
jgi:hypothetical protein